MVAEFERYHLAPYRTLTGALEMAAGAGLLAGLRFRPLLLLSAGSLAGMMLGAIVVRLRVRDPLGVGHSSRASPLSGPVHPVGCRALEPR
ncbi:MAG: DoxX family protein [Gemmatimonadaceae bacterium]